MAIPLLESPESFWQKVKKENTVKARMQLPGEWPVTFSVPIIGTMTKIGIHDPATLAELPYLGFYRSVGSGELECLVRGEKELLKTLFGKNVQGSLTLWKKEFENGAVFTYLEFRLGPIANVSHKFHIVQGEIPPPQKEDTIIESLDPLIGFVVIEPKK